MRQRGTRFKPGDGVGIGKDDTLYARAAGIVQLHPPGAAGASSACSRTPSSSRAPQRRAGAARLLAGGRAALGAAVLAAPRAVTSRWLGEESASLPVVGDLARSLGARDLALGLATLAALKDPALGPRMHAPAARSSTGSTPPRRGARAERCRAKACSARSRSPAQRRAPASTSPTDSPTPEPPGRRAAAGAQALSPAERWAGSASRSRSRALAG